MVGRGISDDEFKAYLGRQEEVPENFETLLSQMAIDSGLYKRMSLEQQRESEKNIQRVYSKNIEPKLRKIKEQEGKSIVWAQRTHVGSFA